MNVKTVQPLIFLSILICSVVNAQRQATCCQEYCYAMDNERTQSVQFGTKTPYEIAKGVETGRDYLLPNCNPQKIWLYVRHGTQLPTEEETKRFQKLEFLKEEIIDNYEKRGYKPPLGALCEGDLDLLRGWHWNQNVTADKSEFLTVQGWTDLKFIAMRLQRNFPNIAQSVYDPHKFQFNSGNSQKGEASYKAFVEGLFGENAYRYIQPTTSSLNDSVIRSFKQCPKYDAQAATNVNSEYAKFAETDVFKQLISDVSARLGFQFPLKLAQIEDIYDMCRYDFAWNLAPSPWCIAFTPQQIAILEYREDLEHYYRDGYGQELNSKLNCAAVSDLLKTLESNDSPQMVTYITEGSGLLLLLNALGYAKDSDSLRADNYYGQSHRRYLSSQLCPFGGNFAAIKYDCPNDNERHKVLFFLNEKPLFLDGCKAGLCDLSYIKEKYKYYANADCTKASCGNSGNTLHITLLNTFLPLIVTILLVSQSCKQ